jgi:hypothetical protein
LLDYPTVICCESSSAVVPILPLLNTSRLNTVCSQHHVRILPRMSDQQIGCRHGLRSRP